MFVNKLHRKFKKMFAASEVRTENQRWSQLKLYAYERKERLAITRSSRHDQSFRNKCFAFGIGL